MIHDVQSANLTLRIQKKSYIEQQDAIFPKAINKKKVKSRFSEACKLVSRSKMVMDEAIGQRKLGSQSQSYLTERKGLAS